MKSGAGYTMMTVSLTRLEWTRRNGSDGKIHVIRYFATMQNCEIPKNGSIINMARYGTDRSRCEMSDVLLPGKRAGGEETGANWYLRGPLGPPGSGGGGGENRTRS